MSFSSDKCFLTGCDSNFEWMLPWCVSNIQRHMPDIPVVVADFGMSKKGLQSARDAGVQEVLSGFQTSGGKKSWFLKPDALLRSPYEKTVWIDVDCEVVAPCPEIFNYCISEKLALTYDPWAKRRGRAYWATGVIGVKGSPMILKEWATHCRKARGRGDQELLYSIIGSSDIKVNRMPPEFQWLRLDIKHGLDSDSKKVIHWTGPHGKTHIRRLLSS